ncbi:cytochrome P450 [Williamsia maris]|uniref:Cytochrome P450 n=1 Tax=Williamsia maris TaxID=72806 RepID=A0ABT1HFB1_9NOCA|nr:cytochrome P450 [Williamsia maris]MCP2176420.1 Cytochrome P450 [Williamsia maris]
MTDTDTRTDSQAEIPSFPMKRASGCPFDPPPLLGELQSDAPVTRVRLADGRTPWLVTKYHEQRQVLADRRISSDIRTPGHPYHSGEDARPVSFITMDDPEHLRLRRMVTAPFGIKRVEKLRPTIQAIVDDLIDAMLAGPPQADLVEAFALPVPSLVISEMLGVPYADHDFFQENSRLMVSRAVSRSESAAGHQRLIDYLTELVGAKCVDPGDDLLSELAVRVNDGELTRGDVAEMGTLLLLAGHETTANMIALGTAALLYNPDQLALLRDSDDPAVVTSAVEELLRYLNITHNGRARVALEDIEIGETTVRAGEGLIMANDIGNRDPDAFDDPDRLDITRDARRHVAFGFGVHQCLGQPLARLELQIVYRTLYRRIPTLALDCDLSDVPFKDDAAVYGVHELPVRW